MQTSNCFELVVLLVSFLIGFEHSDFVWLKLCNCIDELNKENGGHNLLENLILML